MSGGCKEVMEGVWESVGRIKYGKVWGELSMGKCVGVQGRCEERCGEVLGEV